jgi:hypothetical protein
MFRNLNDFIRSANENVAQQGQTNHSCLANCAEYCPVNELLPNDNRHDHDDAVTNPSLQRLKQRCIQFFYNFRDIADECFDICEAIDQSDIQKIVQVYNEIQNTLHIFGLEPEFNDQLRP